jgi:hypothetical protein
VIKGLAEGVQREEEGGEKGGMKHLPMLNKQTPVDCSRYQVQIQLLRRQLYGYICSTLRFCLEGTLER